MAAALKFALNLPPVYQSDRAISPSPRDTGDLIPPR
jgi:hypothetical protein